MSNDVAPIPIYDIFQKFKTEILKELRVCLPATVQAVNTDGTIDVLPALMQNIAQKGLPAGLAFNYPLLQSVSVITIQGGGVGFVSPIKVGDQCLVVFSDRCISGWFTSGVPVPLPSFRMHDISDGFAIVGINSLVSPVVSSLLSVGEGGLCETKSAVPHSGAKVAINPLTHKISISNGAAGVNSLFTILTTLFSTLAADPGLNATSHAALLAADVTLATLLY